MKKIMVLLLIIFITFSIYYLFNPKQKTYVAIGDFYSAGKNSDNEYQYGYKDYIRDYYNNNKKLKYYDDNYSYNDYSIEKILDDIKNNDFKIISGSTISIKKSLREADILTITIGINDLLKYLNINDIKDLEYESQKNIDRGLNLLKKDINNLIIEIKKYSKKDIYIIGYYFPNTSNYENINYTIENINNLFKNLSDKHDIEYFDTPSLFLTNSNEFLYPNYKIYKKIAEEFIKKYEKAC